MSKVYSIRANAKIMSLMTEIKELERNQDTTRTGIFERAVVHAKVEKDWNAVFNTEIEEIKGVEIPDSFQVKAEEEDMELITKRILKNVEEIHKLHTVVTVRMILSSYLIYLRKKAAIVGTNEVEKNYDITGPEMVAILVDMLMKDRSDDSELINEIKSKLVDWKDNIYGG